MKYIINRIKEIFYYNPKYGIPNLFKWFKTIYYDRNWDYLFIYDILIKKLEYQGNYLKKNNLVADAEKISNDIFYTVELLKKIRDDEYGYEELRLHDEKWGKGDFEFIDAGEKLWEIKRQYKKQLTEEEEKIEAKELHEIFETSDKERDDDIKKAFSFIAEHIQEWWD